MVDICRRASRTTCCYRVLGICSGTTRFLIATPPTHLLIFGLFVPALGFAAAAVGLLFTGCPFVLAGAAALKDLALSFFSAI